MRTKIQISETEEELKRLLSQSTDGHIREKLQALYWLKSKKLSTVLQVANLLGRHRKLKIVGVVGWVERSETQH